MLFYLKKRLILELAAAWVLGTAGGLGIRAFDLPMRLAIAPQAMIAGVAGALALAAWTFLVQTGYAAAKGRDYADRLTAALAAHFAHARPPQMLAAVLAAAGEEVFFRGFIQGRWGLLAGSVAFMLGHLGKRDIRVIGYWSIFQGLGLGLLYRQTGNLLVPMLAHGLFDAGAMVYFRLFMAKLLPAGRAS